MSAQAARYEDARASDRHVIGELVVDFAISGTEGPLGTPETLAQQVKSQLLPVVPDVLEDSSRAGLTAQIEMLEIDLGHWPEDPSWPDVRATFRDRLSAALAPYLRQMPLPPGQCRSAPEEPQLVTRGGKTVAQTPVQTSLDGAERAAPGTGQADQGSDIRQTRFVLFRRLLAEHEEDTLSVLRAAYDAAPAVFDTAIQALPDAAHRRHLAAMVADGSGHPTPPPGVGKLASALARIFVAAGHDPAMAIRHAHTLTARMLLHPLSTTPHLWERDGGTAQSATAAHEEAAPPRTRQTGYSDRDSDTQTTTLSDPGAASPRGSVDPGTTTRGTPPRQAVSDILSLSAEEIRRKWTTSRQQVAAALATLHPRALLTVSQSLAPGAEAGFLHSIEKLGENAPNPQAALLFVVHAQLDNAPVDIGLARAAGAASGEPAPLVSAPAEGVSDAMPDAGDDTPTPVSGTGAGTPQNLAPARVAAHRSWTDVLTMLAPAIAPAHPAIQPERADAADQAGHGAVQARTDTADPAPTVRVEKQQGKDLDPGVQLPEFRPKKHATPDIPDLNTNKGARFADGQSLPEHQASRRTGQGDDLTGPEADAVDSMKEVARSDTVSSMRSNPATDQPHSSEPDTGFIEPSDADVVSAPEIPGATTGPEHGSPASKRADRPELHGDDVGEDPGKHATATPAVQFSHSKGHSSDQPSRGSHHAAHHGQPTTQKDGAPAAPKSGADPRTEAFAPDAKEAATGKSADPSDAELPGAAHLDVQKASDRAIVGRAQHPRSAASGQTRASGNAVSDADRAASGTVSKAGPTSGDAVSDQDRAVQAVPHRAPPSSESLSPDHDAAAKRDTAFTPLEPRDPPEVGPPSFFASIRDRTEGSDRTRIAARREHPEPDPAQGEGNETRFHSVRAGGGNAVSDGRQNPKTTAPEQASASRGRAAAETSPAPDPHQHRSAASAGAVVDALVEAAFGASSVDFRNALSTIWQALPRDFQGPFTAAAPDAETGVTLPAAKDADSGLTPEDRILLELLARSGAADLDLDRFVAAALQVIVPQAEDQQQLLRLLIARMSYADGTTPPALRYRLAHSLQRVFDAEPHAQRQDAAAPATTSSQLLLTRHAGLVLFHPYYKLLFSRMELLTPDNEFRPGQLPRAAAALAALAGDVGAERQIDPLERVLLGVPDDGAMPKPVGLTPEEAALIDGLIRSVISQWAKLGQTSPAGLQEAFIRRAGHLQFDDAGAHLRVDPGPFDMLLDGLPWTLGPTIALPWMTVPCHVHWRDQDG
ncbi:hypothetical protein KX928_02495 [Roseobacter sp. YSTF-M11]|uniref:Uncharacterized protein n=1 Tax=Roseobacter insulae TaxID=2859783 RepID=A0A9X1K1L9_9RHOB|nr:contractile injection system tape measure protein [Roseobacter insulae]MBW4706647.1 hypothetical protein [Roseobacter insulae]